MSRRAQGDQKSEHFTRVSPNQKIPAIVDNETGIELMESGAIKRPPLLSRIAAISVGVYRGASVLDLDYAEDSDAETDMNVVMNDAGRFIEIQGTAEGHAFSDEELGEMLTLARSGIEHVIEKQTAAIAEAS